MGPFTRNDESEGRSFAEFALDKGSATVCFDDLLHNSKAQPKAALPIAVGFQFVEDSSEPFWLDTGACVAYPATDRLAFTDGLSADNDLALSRIPQRIRKKILEDLATCRRRIS